MAARSGHNSTSPQRKAGTGSLGWNGCWRREIYAENRNDLGNALPNLFSGSGNRRQIPFHLTKFRPIFPLLQTNCVTSIKLKSPKLRECRKPSCYRRLHTSCPFHRRLPLCQVNNHSPEYYLPLQLATSTSQVADPTAKAHS